MQHLALVQVYWTENKFWCLSNRRLAVFRLYQQMYPEDGATIPVEVSASYVHYAAESEILLKSCTHTHTHTPRAAFDRR